MKQLIKFQLNNLSRLSSLENGGIKFFSPYVDTISILISTCVKSRSHAQSKTDVVDRLKVVVCLSPTNSLFIN